MNISSANSTLLLACVAFSLSACNQLGSQLPLDSQNLSEAQGGTTKLIPTERPTSEALEQANWLVAGDRRLIKISKNGSQLYDLRNKYDELVEKYPSLWNSESSKVILSPSKQIAVLITFRDHRAGLSIIDLATSKNLSMSYAGDVDDIKDLLISFSSDESLLAINSPRQTHFIDLTNSKVFPENSNSFYLKDGTNYHLSGSRLAVTFSPYGIYQYDVDSTVWEKGNGWDKPSLFKMKLVKKFEYPNSDRRLDSSKQLVILHKEDEGSKFFDINNLTAQFTFPAKVTNAVLSDDRSKLAFSTGDTLYVYNYNTKERIMRAPFGLKSGTRLDFVPGESGLIVGEIYIPNLSNLEIPGMTTYPDYNRFSNSMQFSIVGNYSYTLEKDGIIKRPLGYRPDVREVVVEAKFPEVYGISRFDLSSDKTKIFVIANKTYVFDIESKTLTEMSPTPLR